MSGRRSIVVTGGGTGGHILPALSVAEALARLAPGVELHYVGGPGSMEERLAAEAGLPFHTVRLRPFAGKPLHQRLLAIAAVPPALARAAWLLRRLRAKVAVVFGGYVSLAVGLVAPRIGVPLVVQEQNAVPGRTNRLLARKAKVACVGFPPARDRLAARSVVCTGNPVREAIEAVAQLDRTPPPPLSLLVLGGSQGARFLNETAPAVAACLRDRGIEVRVHHQCGRMDPPEAVAGAYLARGIDARVEDFVGDMAGAYAAAHICLGRAGASTVAELVASATPAVLVPFPHATDDHQTLNAACMAETGASLTLRQEEASPEAVAGAVAELGAPAASWRERVDRLLRARRSGAAEAIARQILEAGGLAGEVAP